MTEARIVVVEDEAIVAMDLRAKLEDLGHSVLATCHSGEEAVRLVHQVLPDLVLMDIRLSGEMDGIQAAGQLWESLGIPVVFLTAYADETTLDRAKLTEPLGYLLKPVDHKALQTVVGLALYKHRVDQELRANQKWLAAVLKSVSEAVVTTDDSGLVTFMNPAAEALLETGVQEAQGQRLTGLLNLTRQEGQPPSESP